MKRIGFRRGGGDVISYGIVTDDPFRISRPTQGLQQVLIEGTRYSESPSDAQVAVLRHLATRAGCGQEDTQAWTRGWEGEH